MRDFTLFLTTCFSQAVQNENLQFRRRGVNKLKGHDFAMTKSALGPIQDFRHFFFAVFLKTLHLPISLGAHYSGNALRTRNNTGAIANMVLEKCSFAAEGSL